MKRIIILILLVLILNCKGSKNDNQQSETFSHFPIEIYPKDRSSVLPSEIEIYAIIDFQPNLESTKFFVWKEGQLVVGNTRVEKVSKLYKIIYDLIDKSEGTYLVYFAYGERATFWTFFSETTKTIPTFEKLSIPRDKFKGFPYGTPIIISEEKLMNPMTIDDETVILKKKFLFEETYATYDISFLPNSVIINLIDYESSRNYKAEITGILFMEGNPEFSSTTINFRTIDTDKPFVKTCSPDFCVRRGSCSAVSSLKNFEIIFGDNEEIDPLSVIENLVVESNGSKVIFGEVWSISESRNLIHKNASETSKVYVFPNRIFFDFGYDVKNSKISIYILPKLSDTSGNSIDSFFSWCIDVS